MQWQPISTNPKTPYQPFIAWWCGQGCLACWHEEQNNWQEYPDGDFECCAGEELTHWMPLPSPPEV